MRKNMKTKIRSSSNHHFGRRAFAALLLALACAAAISAQAGSIIVANTDDTGPDTLAPGSLREALANAVDGDTIDATGITGTITLMPGMINFAQLVVDKSVTILGPGPANLTVDANHLSRVFHVTPGHTVTIDGLSIVNGSLFGLFPASAGGGIYNDHSSLTVSNCTLSGNSGNAVDLTLGGGIFNDGSGGGNATLTVANSTISGNLATDGGGIFNNGSDGGNATLTVTASMLNDNSALGFGGGAIFNDTGLVFVGAFGNATLTVSASTLSGNSAVGAGGGILSVGEFAGNAKVTVDHTILSDNSAEFGGGIVSFAEDSGNATLTVDHSTLSGNSGTGSCGGIFNGSSFFSNATLTVDHSTLSGNSATAGFGGGIYNDGSRTNNATATIANSTLSGNSADDLGGAIYNDGTDRGHATVALGNCTLSGNFARVGGAIVNDGLPGDGDVKVLACTLSGNSASAAVGGIASGGSTEVGNTILKDGHGGNLLGNVVSFGFNLSSDDGSGYLTGTSDQINKDPLLGPLADNGGPTLTHLPLPGSPAIDQGSSDTLAVFGITTDQRGFPRTVNDPAIPNAPFGDGTDIGSVEAGAAAPPPPVQHADLLVSLGVDKTSVKQGEQLTYTITVHNFGPDTAANVVVNDTLSSGTTFVSAQANKGNFTTPQPNQTGVVTWNLGNMSNGDAEGAQLVVKVIVKGKTTITNTATASTDSADPNPANNTVAIAMTVAPGSSGGKK